MRIAVLVPAFFRSYGLRRVLQSIRDTVQFDHIEGLVVDAIVAHEPDDIEAERIAQAYKTTLTCNQASRRGSIYAWNTAMSAAPDYDAYVLGSDDMYFMYGVWAETFNRSSRDLG